MDSQGKTDSGADLMAQQTALQLAPQDAQRLIELLESEFESLKVRDLALFERLQTEKNEILERLAQLAQWATQQTPPPAAWQDLQAPLLQCREAHFRNIQLMQRQLQAVRGALQSLQGPNTASVDLYDRLGRMSRLQGEGAYQLA